MRYLVLALKGMAYGITHIVPGLGGAFILILLGIYEEFVEVVGNLAAIRRKWREYIPFLGSLGVGMVIGMVILANLIKPLSDRYPAATMFFFMGLLVGTIPSVFKMHEDMRPSLGRGVALLVGLLGVVVFSVVARRRTGTGLTLDIYSPGGILYNGITSFIAGGASVTPGLDGTYVLLVARTYVPIIDALKELARLTILWAALVPMGLGAVLGILAFSKLIDTAIKRAPAVSYYCILGLIAGSVYGLWPQQPARASFLGLVISFAVGLLLAFVCGRSTQAERGGSPATG